MSSETDSIHRYMVEKTLSALKILDKDILSIEGSAPHVSVYSYDQSEKKWAKVEIEGPLSLVKRKTKPIYQLHVTNSLNVQNFSLPITSKTQLQAKNSYLILRTNGRETDGLWFPESHTALLQNICQLLKEMKKKSAILEKEDEASENEFEEEQPQEQQQPQEQLDNRSEQQPQQPQQPGQQSQPLQSFFPQGSNPNLMHAFPSLAPSIHSNFPPGEEQAGLTPPNVSANSHQPSPQLLPSGIGVGGESYHQMPPPRSLIPSLTPTPPPPAHMLHGLGHLQPSVITSAGQHHHFPHPQAGPPPAGPSTQTPLQKVFSSLSASSDIPPGGGPAALPPPHSGPESVLPYRPVSEQDLLRNSNFLPFGTSLKGAPHQPPRDEPSARPPTKKEPESILKWFSPNPPQPAPSATSHPAGPSVVPGTASKPLPSNPSSYYPTLQPSSSSSSSSSSSPPPSSHPSANSSVPSSFRADHLFQKNLKTSLKGSLDGEYGDFDLNSPLVPSFFENVNGPQRSVPEPRILLTRENLREALLSAAQNDEFLDILMQKIKQQ